LEFLPRPPDGGCSVFEDEFRVPFRGEGPDKVELSLGNFNDGFFGCVAKQIFRD
jgi:hypothetical protein